MEGEAAIEWDESNQCCLTFDEDITVIITLNETAETIFMNWILGALPTAPGEVTSAMQELLEANHEWNHTEGGALGLDSETGLVTLSYRVDLPLEDAAVIQDIIARLYSVSSHWQKSLNLGYPDEAAASTRSAHVPP